LKRAVTEEPVLRLPDYTVPFEVHTEASDYAIGRVLVQEGHPVAYESRKLNETERRGPRERDDSSGALPEDMEALLAFGLDMWSTTGGHKRLCYTEEAFSKTGRQDFLAEFDFVLESKYKPGRTNQVADALSRKAELVAGEELAAICRIQGTVA
jgi:hypothetical protein